MYSAGCLWSEVEDDALREYFPRHGAKWDGWQEVLPKRTIRAVEMRAKRLGLRGPQRPRSEAPKRSKPSGDDWHYKTRIIREPDQHERYVMSCMAAGMTPDEIDKARHWIPGTAKRVLMARWERENER